ncbi:PPOX class F420-dependent oxidoreductase [Haliea sp. E1-2-M8]|uniref:PPOX class F420-dependent oxidoreductase n=1 Tax=Haliea sp. E1-2-M8 TaxID=3064706 RepID=UPI0027170B0E|nr:PPOX class F420-dependent oxidoreductase [Haliea sp. E1-2-M8]MDO8863002.1 PPOX class F420-dependent oxidoreductase [Haliea sp. E1-2-M8]
MAVQKTVPDSHKAILEKGMFAFVSTIRVKDQLISTNPVGFDWDGETFRFSTLKSRVKYRNLQADSRITICVLDPVNPTRYVEIRGHAELTDDPGGSLNQKLFRKSMGRDFDLDEPDAERVIVTVIPEQVSTPLLYGGRLDHVGS